MTAIAATPMASFELLASPIVKRDSKCGTSHSFLLGSQPMRLSALSAVLLFAIACGSESSPTSTNGSNKSYDVYTVATAFSPTTVTIAPGDTVVFHITKAPDGDGHDVTFDGTPGAPAN